MDEGRKRVLLIAASILAAWHSGASLGAGQLFESEAAGVRHERRLRLRIWRETRERFEDAGPMKRAELKHIIRLHSRRFRARAST